MSLQSSIPIIGGALDDSGDQYMDQLRQMRGLMDKVQTPEFANYKPEDYSYSGDYNPEEAMYKTVSEDPRLRNAQLSALEKMSGLAQDGQSAEDQAAFAQARNQAGQIQRSGSQAALQNAEARGVAGSGMEMAMRQMAQQDASQQAQTAGLAQASNAARQRMLANQAFGDMSGQMRGQDMTANSKNSDIINQFNMANTNNRNTAQQSNLSNRQNVNNQNTTGHNDAFKYNQGQQQQTFQNHMTKATGQMGANQAMANGYAAQNAANTSERNQMTQAGMQAATMAVGAPPVKK